MTNLPITINNSQPPTKGTSGDTQPPRSNFPTATANAATGAANTNDTSAQPADPFDAVLARQMQADEANTAASNVPPAFGIDAKVDSAATTGKVEQDKILPTTDMLNDPSSILAAMLQFSQEIKPSAARNAIASTTPRGMIDITATNQGVIDAAVTAQVTAGITVIRETSVNTVDISQLTVDSGAMQAKAGLGVATVTSGKAGATAMNIDNLAVADRLALRNVSGLEIIKPPELPVSLPDTARSAQSIAQSAQSIAQSATLVAASGMLPAMSTNDKVANSLQTISSPLGSSGWADEFSQKITWMGTQQNQVAELHLNPPNLGPLDVVLKISDNQATALFTSPHSAVRDAVENALPKLREMLADNGIMLGNTMVSDQPPRDRSANGFMDHGAGAAVQRATSDDALKTLSSTTAQTIPARRHNGMVDTFA